MTRNGASPIIRKSTINVIGTLALRRASRIMFQKIANVLSIISFLMVSSMSVGAYLAIQYMRSPEFERTLKNKIMGDLKEKMIEEIPKQLPEFSGPSIPMVNKKQLDPDNWFDNYIEKENKKNLDWEIEGKWKR